MRQFRKSQLSLVPAWGPHQHTRELQMVARILDAHPGSGKRVQRDLLCGRRSDTARRGLRPPRRPESTSACRTHFRSVSAVQPIFEAMDPIASHFIAALAPVLEQHPHGPLSDLPGTLAGPCHLSILSRNGASGKPGAVHSGEMVWCEVDSQKQLATGG